MSIFAVHSYTVIGYPDERDTAVLELDLNRCSSRVDTVIYKLLNDGYRTFDDLSCLDGISRPFLEVNLTLKNERHSLFSFVIMAYNNVKKRGMFYGEYFITLCIWHVDEFACRKDEGGC